MKRAFTLAEVLITLAIIGVVAAISIPSVISNSQQQEFKTGLRKAVSVLNSAIAMNMALDGESPYDNGTLMPYLMRHMNILKSTTDRKQEFYDIAENGNSYTNAAFYTADGMRFEFRRFDTQFGTRGELYLHESRVKPCSGDTSGFPANNKSCGGCGSYGLNSNVDGTTKPPCIFMVDVNGDRKPNPANVNCKEKKCAIPFKYADPLGIKLTDMFTIIITDKEAIPFGVAAQRAMYQAQAKK